MKSNTILLTGANGFLGKTLVEKAPASFSFVSLGRGRENDISVDLGESIPEVSDNMDGVVHAAGKAHLVPNNEEDAADFFKVNVQGTRNLLAGLPNIKGFVFISTVAVYGVETGEEIDENHPIIPTTPYGESKLKAEKVVLEWGQKTNTPILILRLPLIFSDNAPGNLGAMENAIKKGFYFHIGGGKTMRSIVYPETILKVIQSFFDQPKTQVRNLVDRNISYHEVANHFAKKHYRRFIPSIPLWPLRILSKLGDVLPFFPLNSYRLQKLTSSLTFTSLYK